ncbi:MULTISPECIES: Crp/Fnr family transcriptional regulator [unclassified Saccharicrinis]|uniref:Crp/Fnr family transcriptional regulator n=1 Tax=unclassified Saccharicrinis TaxID=2646859 RepID=UPI003D3559EA
MNELDFIADFFQKQLKIPLDKVQKKELLKNIRKETFKKKELIFSGGSSNTKQYIIEKGLIRLFLIDKNGKEFNILFAKENQVIGDLSSPEPTSFFMETIEESIVYSIDNAGLSALSEFIKNNNDYLKRSYIFIQKRLVSILSKSAEENYIELKTRYPDLIKRLPQYHIASYIGVSAEFLSKIIKKLAKK